MSEILTREEWLAAMVNVQEDKSLPVFEEAHTKIMRHDAALRAENAALFGQTALERRRADNEKARAEKLAAALRDAGECLSKWDTEVAKARQIIARALADGEGKK